MGGRREVDVDEQEACFDANDVERHVARGLQVVGPTGFGECVPGLLGVRGRDEDLETEVSGVARARNSDRCAGQLALDEVEVRQPAEIGIGQLLEQIARRRAL